MIDNAKMNSRETSFDVLITVALFVFGTAFSVIFWGYQPVPNPDFFGFIEVARAVLSWQFSSIDYRQLPGLGLLQIGFSFFIEGEMADLKAGWLLNAILYPCNIVLVWLIGKRINGESAVWVAILVAINPFVLKLTVVPIAETTFLFFILLTFYCIFRQSRFSYLVASLSTMVRWEGAALIFVAFVIDMINCSSNRQRIRAFVCSILAVVPLTMWILLTIWYWDSQGDFYFRRTVGPGKESGGFLEYINMMWKMGFYPLYSAAISIVSDSVNFATLSKVVMENLSKVAILGMLVFGTVHGFLNRQWEMLALHTFLWPYLLIHSMASVLSRHAIATHWILLIVFLYGLQSAWKLIDKSWPVRQGIIKALQSLVFVLALIYIWKLSLYHQKFLEVNRSLLFVPYVAMLTVTIVMLVKMLLHKGKSLGTNLLASLLVCCMIVTGQPHLVSALGDGKKNFEFKLLADWYRENAEPGKKMVVTLGYTTGYFSGWSQDYIIRYKEIKADSPADFVQQCQDLNITYIAWDSKHGLKGVRREVYYNKWAMKNIDLLEAPRDVGPYTFITQIKRDEKHYINVFRLSKKE